MSDLERKKLVQAEKVRIWTRCIRAGREAQREYREKAAEVLSYFQTKHPGIFEQIRETYLDLDEQSNPVCVNLAALVRAVWGPNLYQRNPRREVSAQHDDAVAIGHARTLETYLNYSAREGKIGPEIRRMIDDGLVRGRGVMRAGYDDDRGIVTSWSVSSLDLVIDPGALRLRDADWIAIRSRLPLWRVQALYGAEEKWRVEGLRDRIRSKPQTEANEEIDPRDAMSNDYMSDQVEVWEVFSKRGNGLTRGPYAVSPGSEYANDDDSNLYVKLTLVLDHETLLEEGEWENPVYLDKEWPIAVFDPVEGDKLWPDSPMSLGMVHQKVLDVLATLEFEAAKIHARDIYFYRSDCLTDEDIQRLLRGAPGEAIPIRNLPAGINPADVIFRPNLGNATGELRLLRDWHIARFELITGVLPVLQGGATGDPVDRSATASSQRQRAASTRVGEILSRVEEACTDLARIEAMAVMLSGLVSAEEVNRVVGRKVKLGFRVGTIPPIRTRGRGLSIEKIAPEAATYFDEEEQVAAVLPLVWDGLLRAVAPNVEPPPKPELIALVAVLQTSGMTPEGIPAGLRPVPVTPADTIKDTAGLGPRQVLREYSFSIAAGSTQRQDPVAKREHAEMLIQQVLPIAMKMGDYNAVNMVLARADDAFGVPVDERVPELKPPPPPPPPMPAPGAPPGQGAAPGGPPPAMPMNRGGM